MKKRFMALMLVMTLAASSFVACSKSDDDKDETTAKGTDAASSTTVAGASTTTAAETTTPDNAITGDANAKDAFVVWGWNDDIKKVLDALYKDESWYSRIVFVNTGGSNYYRGKLNAIIENSDDPLYPDIMGLEVDYVKDYVGNKDLLATSEDLKISTDDMKDMYKYNVDLGTDESGNVKAFFWQATPGSWQLRADFCQKYLGTTDPAKLQSDYFATWDKVLATADKVNKDSKGMVKLLSGYSDVFRVYSNSRKTGWYNSDDVIQVDDSMKAYMEIAKKFYDGEYSFNTTQWGTDWYANMAGDGEKTQAALAYTGCPWFTYWCLDADKTDKDGKVTYEGKWTENTILVQGPQQFFWGGTGLAATAKCADMDLASTIIKGVTCNADNMVKINQANSDYVNNKTAIQKIITGGTALKCALLYPDAKQDIISFYQPLADSIDASIVTAEDMSINDFWATAVDDYAQGKKGMDDAVSTFKSSVHDTYSYLKVE